MSNKEKLKQGGALWQNSNSYIRFKQMKIF